MILFAIGFSIFALALVLAHVASARIKEFYAGTFFIDYDFRGRVKYVVCLNYQESIVYIDNVVYNNDGRIASVELPSMDCQFKLRTDGNWDRIYKGGAEPCISKNLYLNKNGGLLWTHLGAGCETVYWGTATSLTLPIQDDHSVRRYIPTTTRRLEELL